MRHLLLVFFFGVLLASCVEKETGGVDLKKVEQEVLKAYNDMYVTYGEGTDEFFKYYEDDCMRVSSSGKVVQGIKKPINDWNEYLKTHSVYLEDFTKPNIIASHDQVITTGYYTEYLIDRETNDSSYNRGIYIAAWRKQEDGSWKICMDTWHSGLDKEE